MNYYRLLLAAASLFLLGALIGFWFNGRSSSLTPRPQDLAEGSNSKEPPIRQRILDEEFELRFDRFRSERTWTAKLRLLELLSAYLRADPLKCKALLSARRALALINPDECNLTDVDKVLEYANHGGGAFMDEMITSAFKHLIETDPLKAFEYLSRVPSHKREEFAMELVRSWSKSDPRAATEAFLNSRVLGKLWREPLAAAVSTWFSADPAAAYKFLTSIDSPKFSVEDMIKDGMARILEEPNADAGFQKQLLDWYVENASDPNPALERLSIVARFGGDRVFDLVDSLPNGISRLQALTDLAQGPNVIPAQIRLSAGSKLPVSNNSIAAVSTVAADLAHSGEVPFGEIQQINDPFQRSAATAAATKATLETKGVNGIAEIIRHGVSSGEGEWLRSAANLISAQQPESTAASGDIAITWTSLPADLTTALVEYANRNLAADQAAKLNAILR